MRLITCDVCNEQFEDNTNLMEMLIPASFFPEANENDPALRLDVCGWPCLAAMVKVGKQPDEEEEVTPEPEEKAFIAVPKLPTIDTNMDEKTLARFTEQATGVKRR